jgi:uncharacterized protein (DUF2236 family)
VNREAAVLLGGGRALLLQVAHPLVAAGVAAHSHFRERPLERLWRTLDLMLTMVFASAAEAIRAVRAIERVHAQVHGTLDADVGPFPRGTPYDANDPSLLLWVHATLVDSALLCYELLVERLAAPVKSVYYEESKVAARLLGIPDELIPRTLDAFEGYMRGLLAGDVLAVGPASREIAASILQPPVFLGLRPAFAVANLFTVALLPPVLRERYALSWGAGWETAVETIARASRLLVPLLPGFVRFFPHARRAVR